MSRRKVRPKRRYPSQALIDLFPYDTMLASVAEILGVTKKCVGDWKRHKLTLDVYSADRYAIRLGYHPAEVWEEWLQPMPATTKGEMK